MRVGTNTRNVVVQRECGRFPTIRGENPPTGIAYDSIVVRLWPLRFVVQLKWWAW